MLEPSGTLCITTMLLFALNHYYSPLPTTAYKSYALSYALHAVYLRKQTTQVVFAR